jgi:hypothetical protein
LRRRGETVGTTGFSFSIDVGGRVGMEIGVVYLEYAAKHVDCIIEPIMSSILEDTILGKIILTDKAISKMAEHGLYSYHIIDTLKQGFDVKPLIPGTIQRNYTHSQEKQIGIIFKTHEENGEPLGAILVITCWARNVK